MYICKNRPRIAAMKHKSLLFLSVLYILLLLPSCGDLKQVRDLYDDWWPVRASGSAENDYFSASWDGDLGIHGDIVVKYVDKTDPRLFYEETRYYPALSFSKKEKAYCTISIQSLGNRQTGKYMKFKVEDGKIYFEKPNKSGRGSGEFDDGQDLTFLSDDRVKIGNVTYERYDVFKARHPDVFKSLAAELGLDPDTFRLFDLN